MRLVASAMIGLDPARCSDIHHNGDAIEQHRSTNAFYSYPDCLAPKYHCLQLGPTPDDRAKVLSYDAPTERHHNRPPWPKTTKSWRSWAVCCDTAQSMYCG
jgi:hypothetical protein